jgi:CheY-like chemotaxis protein
MKTVLIADDDPITVAKLTDSLSPDEYSVLSARSGKECLKLAAEKNPDIILLDVVMPEMDGLEALEELRKSSEVPVVIMSAFGNSDKVEQARKLGIECFLNKPFDTEILIEILDVVLFC